MNCILISKRIVTLLLLLTICGCGSEVDLNRLDAAKDELQDSLNSVLSRSSTASKSSRDGYEELSQLLSRRDLSDRNVRSLEDAMRKMKSDYQELMDAFDRSVAAGNELRSLLRSRAKQNSNKEWRNKLLESIDEAWNGFEEKADSAEEQIELAGEGIQKFDDVLGYLQVRSGLSGFGMLEEELVDIEKAMTAFIAEVRSYVAQGQLLINQ